MKGMEGCACSFTIFKFQVLQIRKLSGNCVHFLDIYNLNMARMHFGNSLVNVPVQASFQAVH